ncbi:hypothetical protein GCM10011369_31780 [Neiella marina]|uniref:Putative DNA-binding domain-containing protein n=1 Tax=Neiella marina TaxID=508461 RepID=A0A8J2XRL2_9GAMM|nr:DNA-binding domain-containing protein [Neiella marina]GGA87371.1 hypothetical protein GCM10011369_31780 [Neiella marina]
MPSNHYHQQLTAIAQGITSIEEQQNQPKGHLSQYQNNYAQSHQSALFTTYPVTCQLLGFDIFAALAKVYCQHFPPTHWDINHYGDDFAALIASQSKSAKAKAFDWLAIAAVARFERLLSVIYYPALAEQSAEQQVPVAMTTLIERVDPQLQLLRSCHRYLRIDPSLTLNSNWRLISRGFQLLLLPLTP